MNNYVVMSIMIAFCTFCSLAEARVKTIGHGATLNFSAEGIPEMYRSSFETMQRKCVKCHSMERTVVAISTGRAPVTGQQFNKQAVKAYGIKMMRKPNSDMNKQEIRDVVVLLNFFIDENVK